MAGSRRSGKSQVYTNHTQKAPVKFKDLPEKKKKMIKFSVIAAVLVIVAVVAFVSLDLLPHFDGSLHLTAGKLLGVTENDLIVNKRNTENKTDHYYKVGSFDMPEGYTIDENDGVTSSHSQLFYLRPTDTESAFFLSSVSGSIYSVEGAYDLLNPSSTDNTEEDTTQSQSIVSKDKNGKTPVKGIEYLGFTVSDLTMSGNEYQKRALLLTPALDGEFSVLVQVSAKNRSFSALPSDDEMFAQAEKLLDCVTVY